jgi:hypothetical protein
MLEQVRLTPPGENAEHGVRRRVSTSGGCLTSAPRLSHYTSYCVSFLTLGKIVLSLRSSASCCVHPGERRRFPAYLTEHGFVVEHDGWLEVLERPPVVRGKIEPIESAPSHAPVREIEVVRAEPEGVSPDDYFRFMGSLPARISWSSSTDTVIGTGSSRR